MRSLLRRAPFRVAIPCRGGDGWIAGEIYLRNVIRCLDAISQAPRPAVRIVGNLGANPDFVREMRELKVVEGQSLLEWGRQNRIFESLYHRAKKMASMLVGPLQAPELWGVDAVYPSLARSNDSARHVYWIPDFQHLRLPEMFSEAEREKRTHTYQEIADSDGILILSSHDALHDFEEFFPKASVSTRVWRFRSVIPDSDRFGPDPRGAYGVPPKYLYLANQFWAHKDHLTAFRALGRLKDEGITIPVVCTGMEDDYRNRVLMVTLKTCLREHDLTKQVTFLGLVPRRDQIEIFRHAAGVLQPSRFEGWSTVVEDARTLGRPMMLSDIGVHVEQAPKGGRYFKVGDAQDLATSLAQWWPSLKPGPDVAAEEVALRESERRQREAGAQLLAILSEGAAG